MKMFCRLETQCSYRLSMDIAAIDPEGLTIDI
jgi:hypothetical protein